MVPIMHGHTDIRSMFHVVCLLHFLCTASIVLQRLSEGAQRNSVLPQYTTWLLNICHGLANSWIAETGSHRVIQRPPAAAICSQRRSSQQFTSCFSVECKTVLCHLAACFWYVRCLKLSEFVATYSDTSANEDNSFRNHIR